MTSVYIISHCRSLNSLYGASLTFKTVRVGFPNAEIQWGYTYCAPEAVMGLSIMPEQMGASQMTLQGHTHTQAIRKILQTHVRRKCAENPVVILDGDLQFYKSCEDIEFDGILAGAYIPRFNCPFSGAITAPRLHTSFMIIPSARNFLKETARIKEQCPYLEWDAWTPMFVLNKGERSFRWDSGSRLYAAEPEILHAFTPDELSRYDHLFCGSNWDEIRPSLAEVPGYAKMNEAHMIAKHLGSFSPTHNLRDAQDAFFAHLATGCE